MFKFKSTMSDERRREIAAQVIEAMNAGDKERANEIAKQIPLPLPMANVLKADWGVENLKNSGFNLDDAVAAYGEDWLKS